MLRCSGPNKSTQTIIKQLENAKCQTMEVMLQPSSPPRSPSLLDDNLWETDESCCSIQNSSVSTQPGTPEVARQFEAAMEEVPQAPPRVVVATWPYAWVRRDLLVDYNVAPPRPYNNVEALAATHIALNNPAFHNGVNYEYPPLDGNMLDEAADMLDEAALHDNSNDSWDREQ